MAARRILIYGEPMLERRCRPVTDFNERLGILLDDIRQTLKESHGLGLAAPQVGVGRRAAVVLETNVPEGEDEYMIELVNPEIIEQDGEQDESEGCLSIPGQFGYVKRPLNVKIRAQDRNGEWFEVSGTGLTARAFCHELDHLDGILFVQRTHHMLTPEEIEEEGRKS